MQFPKTPIIALTATCPPFVLSSVVSILNMDWKQTKLFAGTLNRSNLIYSVSTKPASVKDQIKWIVQFIQTKFLNQTGIIYCLSKKDAEHVAEKIMEASQLQIKCAVYHADIADVDKERIQRQWRDNRIQVVVATIAFGMGINHQHVRFVIHHSISKSMEGYYQESGRAGRDGEPAECVVLYRGLDACRLTSLVYGESEGMRNVHGMLQYCNTSGVCRRRLLAEYFGNEMRTGDSSKSVHSVRMNINKWYEDQTTIRPDPSVDFCSQKCDACLHMKSPEKYDLRQAAYTLCKLIWIAREQFEEKLTLSKLIEAWRGRSSAFKNKDAIDLLKSLNPIHSNEEESYRGCHLPVPAQSFFIFPAPSSLSNEDLERIVIQLVLDGILGEDFHFTPYSTISYLKVEKLGGQLMRSLEQDGSIPTWWDPVFQLLVKVEDNSSGNIKLKRFRKKSLNETPTAALDVDATSRRTETTVSSKRSTIIDESGDDDFLSDEDADIGLGVSSVVVQAKRSKMMISPNVIELSSD